MLTDFGVSKVVVTGVAATQVGAGTLYWMAPELLDGGASTKASDLWGFACTCYEVTSFFFTLTIFVSDLSFRS
jgi:serine/threonine protein kinase